MTEPENNLSLQDVYIITQAIDLASRRGAFGANEMSQIGASYDRVSRFLAEIEKHQADAAASEKEAALEVEEQDE
jgi:hypothetical protein